MYHTSIERDEHAIVQVVEFILVFTVFLILLSAFFAAVSTQFPEDNFDDIGSEIRVRDIALQLVRETGMTAGADADWESHSAGELNYGSNGLTRLGLALSNDSPNWLSLAKIQALNEKLTYGLVTSVLDLHDGSMLNISFRSVDVNREDIRWGAHRTIHSTTASSYQCVVNIVDDLEHSSDAGVRYIMTVSLFRNGARN